MLPTSDHRTHDLLTTFVLEASHLLGPANRSSGWLPTHNQLPAVQDFQVQAPWIDPFFLKSVPVFPFLVKK